MGSREGSVETYLRLALLRLGAYQRKFVSPGTRGVFDRIVGYKGSVFFIEIKSLDGKLSTKQEREKKKLDDQNLNWFVLYSIKDVDSFIRILKCIV